MLLSQGLRCFPRSGTGSTARNMWKLGGWGRQAVAVLRPLPAAEREAAMKWKVQVQVRSAAMTHFPLRTAPKTPIITSSTMNSGIVTIPGPVNRKIAGSRWVIRHPLSFRLMGFWCRHQFEKHRYSHIYFYIDILLANKNRTHFTIYDLHYAYDWSYTAGCWFFFIYTILFDFESK